MCICMCMCVYIYTYVCVYIYIYIYTYRGRLAAKLADCCKSHRLGQEHLKHIQQS